MKKFISIALVIVLAITTLAVVTACNKEEDIPTIESISVKLDSKASFVVGKAFDTSVFKVTAKMSDGTSRLVETTDAINFDRSTLKLNSKGNFTEAGKKTVNITFAGKSASIEIDVKNA